MLEKNTFLNSFLCSLLNVLKWLFSKYLSFIFSTIWIWWSDDHKKLCYPFVTKYLSLHVYPHVEWMNIIPQKEAVVRRKRDEGKILCQNIFYHIFWSLCNLFSHHLKQTLNTWLLKRIFLRVLCNLCHKGNEEGNF